MNILTKQLFDNDEFVLGKNPIDDAYDDLVIKANNGDCRAQYLIGCFYYYGRKVETNHSIASNWFKKSAEQNLVDAQTILGYQYMYGDGIAKDVDKAIGLLEKAHAQGSAYACFLLGKIYHFDFFRIKNEVEAFDIGFEEYLMSGEYCFIEWPEMISGLWPAHFIEIKIVEDEQGSRKISAKII